uniref:Putative tail protein n=2 Tax=viral metagenome TaxID=1070528 RepID=A0A6M3KBH5_9ZZZZ
MKKPILLITIFCTVAMGATLTQKVTLNSFNAGELSPLMNSRVDFPQYKSGAKTLQNMLVRTQGPITRRPGTKYIASVKDANDPTRLISFEYSTEDAYIIEIGDDYARFFTDGAPVNEPNGSGKPYEIVTPWDANDVFELQYVQDAGTMRIVHPDYEPYKLTRPDDTNDANWTCTAVSSTTGPFLDENNDTTWTLTPSATTGDGIDIVSTDPLFDDGHVGALFRISHWLESDSAIHGYFRSEGDVQCSVTNKCQRWRYYDVTTGGIWRGTIYVQKSYTEITRWATKTAYVIGDYVTADPDSRSTYRCLEAHTSGTFATDLAANKWVEDTSTWVTVYSQYVQYGGNIQVSAQETEADCWLRIYIDNLALEYSNDDLGWCYYTIALREFLNNGVVEIATVPDPCNVTADVVYDLGGTDATYYWAEGAWSTYRGFPRTVEHHEQRVLYGGSKSYPQTVWSSIIAEKDEDYDDFTQSTESNWSGNLGGPDNIAWVYTLPGMNPIQWIKSGEFLFVGTTKGVGKLGQPNKPITPNYPPIYRVQNHNGCAYIQPANANDAILYVERGGQKVRELSYTFTTEKYTAPDMTILAEHITGNGILEIAFQERPDPVLWCIREDGVLLSFTYQRGNGVAAWSRHTTGASGEFESAACISGATEDEIWAVVGRIVDSTSVGYIEQFQPLNWHLVSSPADQNDCYFVDCGTNDINDLGHLEGETVALFANGRPINTFVVSDGSIDPEDANLTEFTVGLPYTSVYETMPIVLFDNSGPVLAEQSRIMSNNINFYKTLGCSIGPDADNLVAFKFSQDSFATTIDAVTGYKPAPYIWGTKRAPTLYFSESGPVPMTIREINTKITANYD